MKPKQTTTANGKYYKQNQSSTNIVSPSSEQPRTKKARVHEPEVCNLKSLDEIVPKNLMNNHPELTCYDMAGGIQLVACDQGTNEGFIQPFTALYFHTRQEDRDATRKVAELRKATNVIAMVSRRWSKEKDEPVMKHPGKNDNGVVKYKKCYLVRYLIPGGANNENDKRALQTIASVRTNNHRK